MNQLHIVKPHDGPSGDSEKAPSTEQVKKAFDATPKEQADEPSAVAPSCPLQSGCELETLVISCAHHGSRSFRLEVNQEKSAFDQANTLQLISSANSNKADAVTIQPVSNCMNGDPQCPSLELVCDGEKTAVSHGEMVKVLAHSGPTISEDFKSFLKHLLIPKEVQAKRYTLSGTSCQGIGKNLAVISVTPQVAWKSTLEVGYFHDTYKDSNFVRNQGYGHLKVMGQWKVKGGIEATIDESKWKFGLDVTGAAGHQKNNAVSRQIFAKAQGFLDGIMPFMGDAAGDVAKVDIKWPMLSLTGDIQNIERKESNEVGIKGNVALGFNPLIGAEFTVDILQLLIEVYAKPYKKILEILKKAQESAEKAKIKGGVDVKAAVLLTASGVAGGDAKWSNYTGSEWECKGRFNSSFGMKLVADTHIKGVVFTVSAGAGAKIEIKGISADKCQISGELYPVKEDGELSLGGKIDFSGLAIYYSLYAYLGGEEQNSNDEYSDQARRRDSFDSSSSVSVVKRHEREESKELCKILAPNNLYDSGKGKSLKDVEL